MELLKPEYSKGITVNPEQKLDKVGMPVYSDFLELRLSKAKASMVIKLIQSACFDANIIPSPEIPMCGELIEKIADQESRMEKEELIELPINYMIGFWKILVACSTAKIWAHPGLGVSRPFIHNLEEDLKQTVSSYLHIKKKETSETPRDSYPREGLKALSNNSDI